MYWNEAKKLIAALCILVLLSRGFLGLVSYGPLFQDEEFDAAVTRAEQIGIGDIDEIRESPFSYITRGEAAYWYVAFAQSADMLLYTDDICTFNDIDAVGKEERDMLMLSCMYRFFWGSNGGYYPESLLTKAGSLVALMKGFYPTKEFMESEPYREPFVNKAYDMGITTRKSDPYMMYVITKYELLLQLYRAWLWKQGLS